MTTELYQSLDHVDDCLSPDMRHLSRSGNVSALARSVVDRTDLVALIGESLTLRKAGHDYQALCPFHEEKTPSFTVSQGKQFYHCFGCGAHGDALDWMQRQHRLSFRQALEELAGRAGVDLGPTDREALRARRKQRASASVEAAAWQELFVLCDAVGDRVTYRAIDAATRAKCPHIQAVPDQPSAREIVAAKRLVKALYLMYGVRA